MFWQRKKNILITGRSGFVGNHLYRYFMSQSNYYFVQNFCGRINKKNCQDYENIDVVIHAAAYSHNIPNANIYENNINTTIDLIQSFPKAKFVFFSSSAVYGQSSVCYDEYSETNPVCDYGKSKLICEKIMPKNAIILRPCAIIGKNLTHGMIKDVIQKIKEPTKEITLWGQGPGSRKPYIHIDYICSAINQLLDKKASGVFNCAPYDSLSVLEVVNILKKKYKCDKEVLFDGRVINENNNLFITPRKLELLTGMRLDTSRGMIERCEF